MLVVILFTMWLFHPPSTVDLPLETLGGRFPIDFFVFKKFLVKDKDGETPRVTRGLRTRGREKVFLFIIQSIKWDKTKVVWLFIGTQKRLVALHSALVGSRRDGHATRAV
jgi:hypothetical protein